MKKYFERYKKLAPYVNTDLAMYIIMVLIIVVGIIIMANRK